MMVISSQQECGTVQQASACAMPQHVVCTQSWLSSHRSRELKAGCAGGVTLNISSLFSVFFSAGQDNGHFWIRTVWSIGISSLPGKNLGCYMIRMNEFCIFQPSSNLFLCSGIWSSRVQCVCFSGSSSNVYSGKKISVRNVCRLFRTSGPVCEVLDWT